MDRKLLKVCCFGSGYVGTPTMAVMALNNPSVQFYVFDVNPVLIDKWIKGCPIHEQGLEDILSTVRNRNLFFTSDIKEALCSTDVIYIAVPTPTKQQGEGCGRAYDMSFIESVARSISSYYNDKVLKQDIIIVEKSTVPILTHRMLKEVISSNQSIPQNRERFVIVSNPEFLAQGTTIENLSNPDRIVIGCQRQDIVQLLMSLHQQVPAERIITTSTISAELSKLVANCFLAQRVSSINSISLLCEQIGGDVLEIQKCIGSDSRIGKKFLNSSVGFGGSCFKKDLLALIYLAETEGLSEVAEYWRQVVKLNEFRKHQFFAMIVTSRVMQFGNMQKNLKGKKICIFGLSFKKNTDDLRESASIPICHKLLVEGALLQIFDPLASIDRLTTEFEYQGLWQKEYAERITIQSTAMQAACGTHAIVLLTEWDLFAQFDYAEFYSRMQKPCYVFDGRNLLRNLQLEKLGFRYFAIGQKTTG